LRLWALAAAGIGVPDLGRRTSCARSGDYGNGRRRRTKSSGRGALDHRSHSLQPVSAARRTPRTRASPTAQPIVAAAPSAELMTTAAAAAPRIYWLTTEFFPPETGGTGMIASRLTQGLAERGLDIHVITRQTLPHSAAQELVGKVQVRRLNPAGRMKGVGWRAFPSMLGFMVRF